VCSAVPTLTHRDEDWLAPVTIPRLLSDRYELGDILGFGGMSEVHFARDARLHREVAVKVLRADLARDPTFYLRFRREAQNAAALNHPAIVAVYDTGEAQTPTGLLPYIVMEYVEGTTLRDIVGDSGPMEPAYAIEVIADVCQALHFSHTHGIIHRDVKPANIMIDKAGAVKVMDFGIARVLADTGGSRLTQTAAVIGTAQYISPEQASGERVDARSDVYSLGCVLYEILTGEPPFVGDSPVAVAYQHVRKDAAPPSQRRDAISAELDAVVLKALAKNPDNRYQSTADMRTDLIRVHSGQTPQAPKVLTDADRLAHSSPESGAAGVSGASASVRLWLITVAVLAVVAVAVGGGLTVIGNSRHVVRVPDVHGQTQQDAIATLQNHGFKIRGPVPQLDPSVPVGQVISTDPAADTALAGGDEITINVSSGANQRSVPNCVNVTVTDCIHRLADAGFDHPKQLSTPSATVPQNAVIDTIPAAGQYAATTSGVAIEISSGPGVRRIPLVAGQSIDQATTNLKKAGFQIVLTTEIDSSLPAGQVDSTDPPAGTDFSVQSAITLKVSRGNQIPMPNLLGMTYLEVVPFLQSLGYSGPLLSGGDIPGPDTNRNRVAKQDPPVGANINRDGTITVNYGS
jgi:serine/threonine protein kinase